MWLCLGFLLQTISAVAGVVGFCGCLFYISRAYDVVSPYKARTAEDLRNAEKEVKDELIKIGSFPKSDPTKPKNLEEKEQTKQDT